MQPLETHAEAAEGSDKEMSEVTGGMRDDQDLLTHFTVWRWLAYVWVGQ